MLVCVALVCPRMRLSGKVCWPTMCVEVEIIQTALVCRCFTVVAGAGAVVVLNGVKIPYVFECGKENETLLWSKNVKIL